MVPIMAKLKSFEDAERADREYYRRLTPAERLEILFRLREIAHREDYAAS